MAEHGTNEMTNGPTDWNRGPGIGAPSKEGHGVIIQANKGRSHQDYRVPRAAPHPVAPGPPLSLPPLPPCLSVITGPNCSPWHPLLSLGPLPFEEMPPASLLYVSFVSFHDNAPPFPFPPPHRYTFSYCRYAIILINVSCCNLSICKYNVPLKLSNNISQDYIFHQISCNEFFSLLVIQEKLI